MEMAQDGAGPHRGARPARLNPDTGGGMTKPVTVRIFSDYV
jgi:hypothetical protein